MKKSLIAIFIIALSASAGPGYAAAGPSVEIAQAVQMTEGEIRKIDMAAGKITVKHGPIQKLEMPSMTMVFQVKDKALLSGVSVGDMVLFDVERAGGAMTITDMKKID